MLTHAYFQEHNGNYGDKKQFSLTLQRGEFVGGLDFLSKVFQNGDKQPYWNISKVRRYLKKLQKANMIRTKSDKGINIISIEKYDTYQFSLNGSDKEVTQKRHRNGNIRKKIKKLNNINNNNSDFELLWKRLVIKRGNKIDCEKAYSLSKDKISDEDIITKYNEYASQVLEKSEPKFVAHLSTWLNQPEKYWNAKKEINIQTLRQMHNLSESSHKYIGFQNGLYVFLLDDRGMKYYYKYDLEGNQIKNLDPVQK
tara:strand:- start:51 stop:812 length:762 start_codon:yes stop_codon:yes gene_type:complete